MTQPGDLTLAGLGYITVDATSTSGTPYIVGDAGAAAAGSQLGFTRLVDLNNRARFVFSSSYNIIKGLDIVNSVGAQEQFVHLVYQNGHVSNRLEATRFNAGNTILCAFNDCGGQFDIIRLGNGPYPNGTALTVKNVDGHSALKKGIELGSDGEILVEDSWFHNNYKGNLDGTGATVFMDRTMLERGGLRVSDDTPVDNGASGVYMSDGYLHTEANIIRNNVLNGVRASSTSDAFVSAAAILSNDFICGNGSDGIKSVASNPAIIVPAINGLGGLVTSYNGGHGVNGLGETAAVPAGVSINNNSAFLSNTECGVYSSNSQSIQAQYNQWRGSAPFADACPGSGVDTSFPKTLNEPIVIDMDHPFSPSSAILKGQTIRISGVDFDAVNGNPLPTGGCLAGSGILSSSCCRQPARANRCSALHTPTSGNCVEVLPAGAGGNWTALDVTSVTPTTIAAQLPSGSGILCVGLTGADKELISVTKRKMNGELSQREAKYCTNDRPL